MARSSSAFPVLACLMVMIALAPCATATIHVVGIYGTDIQPWHVPGSSTYYQEWANSNGPYRVGDNLEFRFALDDSVAQVNEAGFNACDLRHALAFWSAGGHVFFPLKETGRFFFVSGSGHCGAGQKFFIDVVE